MGAVLHFRICKGCTVGHSHSHLHSCGSGGGHSHSASPGHHGSADDEMLHGSADASNGYRPLPAERGLSDVPLLNSHDDGDITDELDGNFVVQPRGAPESTNVNIRAAMVHVVGDLIQSFGVLTAALIILAKVRRSQIYKISYDSS